jgi:hypothetical protein
MVDTHLINLVVAGLGISAGVAIVIAAVIIGISAIVLHGRKQRGSAPHGTGLGLPRAPQIPVAERVLVSAGDRRAV